MELRKCLYDRAVSTFESKLEWRKTIIVSLHGLCTILSKPSAQEPQILSV